MQYIFSKFFATVFRMFATETVIKHVAEQFNLDVDEVFFIN